MKKILGSFCLTLLLGVTARAQTTLTAWTFDNLSITTNASPQPSAGFGSAAAVGLGSGSNPDVQSLAGSSSGGPNSWRVRATGVNNGWSSTAAIGTQGARYAGSTAGYYKVKVSFDVYATSDAEANLLVQYTTEGTIWHNAAALTSAGIGAVTTNSNTNNSTVFGAYVVLSSGWNNQITADLTGISGVDNNPQFAVRIVNASTGTNCVDTTGAPYNNTSGSWTFDNVAIKGTSMDTVAQWTFESQGTSGFVPHPSPEFGSGTATALGFDTSYHFSDGTVGSTNKPDTLQNGAPFSSSGSTGQNVWRVRGQGPGNGWFTGAPIGGQGAEFDVNTVNYNDVVISFDLFFTSQGEAKMCVLYTTNNWVSMSVASSLFYAANPGFILTNSPSDPNYSPDTVAGTYFYQTTGQNFYNNLIVDFTGVPGVDNNPNFGIRIVNAAQNSDCVAFNGGTYNNSSGNWRYDNVTINGTFTGSTAPTLAYDPTATVDGPFTNMFTDDALWRSKISAVFVNGSVLTNTAYTTNLAGQIVFTPSKSVLLQSSGAKSIVIIATGYGNAKVTQPVAAGVATRLALAAQPAAPSASGGTLIANPTLAITDQYGNGTTNPYPNVTVVASANAGTWTLGGSTNQPSINGLMFFTNLTATVAGSTAVSNVFITFTVSGYTNSANHTTVTNINSSTFTIGAPPAPFTPGNLAVLQIDTVANNTTFSMIEVKPSAAGQTKPVNVVPISATGTNALRLTSSGSAGRLSLSDDGTLLSFVGFMDDSSATLDETFVLTRGVGTLNYTNRFTLPAHYSSGSFGGSQGRSCCTVDNINWVVDDKGGLYYGSGFLPDPNINALNNIVTKAFGGTPYVETQKTAGGSPVPVVYALAPGNPPVPVPNNLATDPIAVDFYLISTNGGATFDVMYILDQVSSTQGIIRKYSWVPDNTQISGYGWSNNSSLTNSNGADSLFATTTGSGGVSLFYTTGGGGTGGNAIIRLTDAAGWNQPMSIVSSNVIYTTSGSTSLKGLTFAPLAAANTAEPTPPPVLIAQNNASVTSASVTITNAPDDPAWRNAITGITVNGSALPAAAYATNQAGKLVLFPAQSALLQTSGAKTIVISAAGYSTNSVIQNLAAGPATQLVITTQPGAPAADGSALSFQPVVRVQDALGNVVTNNVSIGAAPGQNTWTLGGTRTVTTSGGIATYAGLSAFSIATVANATLVFTNPAGLAVTSSPAFTIPAPTNSVFSRVIFANGKFIFNFSNISGLNCSVLATNNVAAPVSNWPVVGTLVESPAGSGNYQFTNSVTTNAGLFYRLRQP